MFSKGGYVKTEPLPEFKIEEVTYGDGRKEYWALELAFAGFVLRGDPFKDVESAKKYLEELLSRKRASQVVSREQVYP